MKVRPALNGRRSSDGECQVIDRAPACKRSLSQQVHKNLVLALGMNTQHLLPSLQQHNSDVARRSMVTSANAHSSDTHPYYAMNAPPNKAIAPLSQPSSPHPSFVPGPLPPSQTHRSYPTNQPTNKPPHLHPQTPPHPLPHRLLKLSPPLPPHLRRLNIRRALIVGLRQHAHHANQYLLHALYGTPALRRLFVVVRVVAGSVQDGDADEAGGVNCLVAKARNTLAVCLMRMDIILLPH